MKKFLTIAVALSFIVNNASAFAPVSTLGTRHPAATPTATAFGKKRDHININIANKNKQRNSIAAVQLNMGSPALVYGAAVATTLGMQTFGFAAAYLLKTEVFYDIFGGLNYLLLAVMSAVLGAGDGALPWVADPRKVLVTVLFAASRSWLLLFLAWRAHERKGDARFDDVLGKGEGPPRPAGFFVFWMVQALWVLLISVPMLFVNSSSVAKPGFSTFDVV